MFARTRLVACIFIAVVSLCRSEPWTVEKLENPKSVKHFGVPSSVSNPDGILQSTTNLQAALNALEADYTYPDCGGYEMAVVVVNKISGGTEKATEAFANDVINAWGVGKASCNNGIVLAIAVADRHMHIATGRGAREYIPDRELHVVIDRMKPLMRESRYDDAAEQCISDIARILSGENLAPSWYVENGVFVCFVCFVGLIFVTQSRKQRRYNSCKRALTQIDLERAEAKAHRYQVTSCAICLETFAQTPRTQTRLLSCGHTFHASCVDGWEGSHGSCPICRQPTRPEVTPSASSLPQQRAGTALSSYSGYEYQDEYRFRIRRAQQLYPDIVTQRMADNWLCADHCGSLVADSSFIRASPSYKSPGSSSSSSGSSSSFGGGCSFGGGGAGGSW